MKIPESFVTHFANRTAIVTGGGSGIGKALCLLLVRAGARVHALDCMPEGLELLENEVSGPGSLVSYLLDVTDAERYAEVIEEISGISDKIDFLFNNAGVTLIGEAHQVPFDRWRWLLEINLMGVVNGIHLVYPRMVKQGSGTIINTSSIAGGTGYATACAYTASKAAVFELTRSLDAEARLHNVKIKVACPGYVNSNIFKQERLVGVDREKMINDLPVKMLTPEEAAFGFLKGVVKDKRTIIFPFTARFLWNLGNWAPSLIAPFQKRFMRVFQ
ncbi:MAG: SDR family oxidoreductase [Luteolibacter sp.]